MRFATMPDRLERIDFALAGGGATLFGVSATDRGTYSLDTTARAADGWRKEGDWELSFQCCGLLVPDLDVGLCPRTTRLCVCDVRRSLPLVRYTWNNTRTFWPTSFSQVNIATVARLPDSSLAYLGDGEFCIAWTMAISEVNSTISQRALCLMGVKIGKNSPSAPSACSTISHASTSCRTVL
ncbi:hypothetical protein D1007_23347 [Hordeum vulgare]|nr:hypothetical protein D1007_23347 [Hordeum vulgare]